MRRTGLPGEGMSDKEILYQVINNTIKNIVFYGIVVGIIALIGSWFWWVGIVLAVIFIVFLVLSIVHSVMVTGMGVMLWVMKLVGKKVPPQTWHLEVANIVFLFEFFVLMAYGVFLYHWFFGISFVF
jgi:hypothetical protein